VNSCEYRYLYNGIATATQSNYKSVINFSRETLATLINSINQLDPGAIIFDNPGGVAHDPGLIRK
jgi:hypothetical protein